MTELQPRMTEPDGEPAPARKSGQNTAVRVVAIALSALAILWLGYGIGRVQNIVDVSRLTRDVDVDRYTLSAGGTLVHYERLGGDGKPYVRSSDGYELLDVSDWDHNSHIVVDGSSFELVRLYPTSSVDYSRKRLAETLQGDGWLLQREVDLDADGVVHISHSFVARRAIHHVDLELTHLHDSLLDLQIGTGEVSASVTRQTRDQVASGTQAPAAYRLQVSTDAGSPPITYRSGDAGPLGATSFVAVMSADEPPIDERAPLGAETIHIQPVS